jgi:type II pantothenate kinase
MNPTECFYLNKFDFKDKMEKSPYGAITYPYMIVNIGSGVSILKVDGLGDYQRVGGTSLGGGTFYGLCRALTGCESFSEALELAENGKASNVNLLVQDIYGGDYTELNLSGDTIASSFGKLVRSETAKNASKADLARAVLVMITNNIGALANLWAHQVLHVPQIIFVGNFLATNTLSMRTLAHATNYWSKGTTPALFLEHEGYFGAIGALLA